jgi:hypothetical protein
LNKTPAQHEVFVKHMHKLNGQLAISTHRLGAHHLSTEQSGLPSIGCWSAAPAAVVKFSHRLQAAQQGQLRLMPPHILAPIFHGTGI